MAVSKNQLVEVWIESITSEGNDVGKYDGQAIFVPLTAPQEKVQVRIAKTAKKYAYAILENIIEPSKSRIETDCAVYRPCGGCQLRHLTYEEELKQKEVITADCFSRIGKIQPPVLPILPSPILTHYRNKVQFPVQKTADGKVRIGFFAARSHRIVASENCLLQPQILNNIAQEFCKLMEKYGISAYDELSHTGLVRHIYLRTGWHSGEVLLCLVLNGTQLPHGEEICNHLHAQFPKLKSIVVNINTEKTNVITGKKCFTLTGTGIINDTMCEVPVEIGPLSFYQINTPAAEQLYRIAAEFAQLKPTDILLDLYCGMGTIGLSMIHQCAQLIGVEVIPEAVESAKRNAAKMKANNASFICADAGEAATRLAEKGLNPNVVLLDPPRKGCDYATLSAIIKMSPERIVMISCNPATAARDTKYLIENGYLVEKIQPADLFPRTKHIETLVLLSQQKPDDTIEIDLDLDELDATAAETKATYEEIKAYVWEKYHLKVSNLYVSQIKRKCGLEVGQNYNLSKSENPKVPKCPPEKEMAIMDALKHFQMI